MDEEQAPQWAETPKHLLVENMEISAGDDLAARFHSFSFRLFGLFIQKQQYCWLSSVYVQTEVFWKKKEKITAFRVEISNITNYLVYKN